MSGFEYSFTTHYAKRVIGRGHAPVVHAKQVQSTRIGTRFDGTPQMTQFPAKQALCGVEAGPYVGGSSVPNCRKCIARLRQIERTGEEGKNSAKAAVAASELLARVYAAEEDGR